MLEYLQSRELSKLRVDYETVDLWNGQQVINEYAQLLPTTTYTYRPQYGTVITQGINANIFVTNCKEHYRTGQTSYTRPFKVSWGLVANQVISLTRKESALQFIKVVSRGSHTFLLSTNDTLHFKFGPADELILIARDVDDFGVNAHALGHYEVVFVGTDGSLYYYYSASDVVIRLLDSSIVGNVVSYNYEIKYDVMTDITVDAASGRSYLFQHDTIDEVFLQSEL